MARCLLKNANLENKFWVRAFDTAFYITNRCLTSSLPKGKTPLEMFFGKKPDLPNVRVFRCVAYKVIETHQDKLSPKATKELFVDYASMSNAYILFDPKTGKTSASRNVSFNEHSFSQSPLHKDYRDKNVSFTGPETYENLIPSLSL